MTRYIFVLLAFAGVALYSCKNNRGKNVENVAENSIQQQQDGTISLKVEKADTYSDASNPESNTAEWSVVVSKKGRYNIWLSSETKDTTKHQYESMVRFNIIDNQIETKPTIDKVIANASDVSYPYFKADSYIGSLYIQNPGVYNVQVISDKIIRNQSAEDDTRILSVSLTPVSD